MMAADYSELDELALGLGPANVVQQATRAMANGRGKPTFGPVRETSPQVSDRQARRDLDVIRAADMGDIGCDFDDELIEGVIGRNSTAVLFGDSNSGKTFLAIDLASCIASGAAWMGRRVVQGLVIYLATEAAKSVEIRVQARQAQFGIVLDALYVVRTPLNFFTSQTDVSDLIHESPRVS